MSEAAKGAVKAEASARGFAWTAAPAGGSLPVWRAAGLSQHQREGRDGVPRTAPPLGCVAQSPQIHIPGRLCLTHTPHTPL